MRTTKQPGRTRGQRHTDRDKSLYNDALDAARQLRRKHRAVYDADRRHFRDVIKKAVVYVCRLRPGPKADPRIKLAAREKHRGAKWSDLFSKYVTGHGSMPEFTRVLAEDGFRRKVNEQLRHSRRKTTGLRTPTKNRTV